MENKSKDCPIVIDMLPLYLDQKISKESAIFVQEHLKICDSCKKEYQWMQTTLTENMERKSVDLRKETPKLFTVTKKKIFLYGYLLLLMAVVWYCIVDFFVW